MRRRIIKQQTAYTVTLPIEWVRDFNVKAKDEVEMSIESDALVIRTHKAPRPDQVDLVLETGTHEYYRIMVENHYLKGFDIINLQYPEGALPAVRKIISNLIGFEIVEHTRTACRIVSMSPPSSEQFFELLSRSLNIISHTQTIILQDVKDSRFNNLASVQDLSDDARRLLLFCTRSLHKTSIVSRRDESFVHLLLERLILLEHNHQHMYAKLAKLRSHKTREAVKDLYVTTCIMFDKFKQLLANKDPKGFSTIIKLGESLYFKEGHDLFVHCRKEESIVIYHAMRMSRLVFLISQPNLISSLKNPI